MAARTSSRVCHLSRSSRHKHRCTGWGAGCLWQHESNGDHHASLWQPCKAEYPGGKHRGRPQTSSLTPQPGVLTPLASDTSFWRHPCMLPIAGAAPAISHDDYLSRRAPLLKLWSSPYPRKQMHLTRVVDDDRTPLSFQFLCLSFEHFLRLISSWLSFCWCSPGSSSQDAWHQPWVLLSSQCTIFFWRAIKRLFLIDLYWVIPSTRVQGENFFSPWRRGNATVEIRILTQTQGHCS